MQEKEELKEQGRWDQNRNSESIEKERKREKGKGEKNKEKWRREGIRRGKEMKGNKEGNRKQNELDEMRREKRNVGNVFGEERKGKHRTRGETTGRTWTSRVTDGEVVWEKPKKRENESMKKETRK